MTSLFCGHDEGMFPSAAHSPEADLYSDETVAFHEAAHAVAAYALGLGIRKIEMRAEYSLSPFGQGLSGMTFATRRLSGRARRSDFSPLIAAIGIYAAAGAAAERKFAFEVGITPQPEFGSEEDYKIIDGIDRLLGLNHVRTPHAYKRLVWRRAQLLVSHPVYWAAIHAVAGELVAGYIPLDCDCASGDHCSSEIMPGQRARAIIRRAGVRPGMFAFAAS
jgi:hypothetical protein